MSELATMRKHHPDWIWNRSDTHVFLGVPRSLEAYKTPVEPGNSFSPGVRSFGVSTWLFDHHQQRLYATEELPLSDFEWHLEPTGIPLLTSKWHAGPVLVQSELFTYGDWYSSKIDDYLRIILTLDEGYSSRDISLYIVLRSFGAAGGPVCSIGITPVGVQLNRAVRIFHQCPPTGFGAVSYSESCQDICLYLRNGALPGDRDVNDSSGWASGALEYRTQLRPLSPWTIDFQFPVHASHQLLPWLKPENHLSGIVDIKAKFNSSWQDMLHRVEINVPDERFKQAFYTQIAHLFTATVHNEIRISNISYPIWWLRDGAYILVALDRVGLHDFAKQACLSIAQRDAFGGMGAEGDGPGESIWILANHYMLTRDHDYLQAIYQHVVRKADLLVRMRHTTEPMKYFTEFGTLETLLSPSSDVLCGAAEKGLIKGRMDWHYPVFWVNGFAYAGLQYAARMSKEIGDLDRCNRYHNEAMELRQALLDKVPTEFGRNERDVTCALWPSGVLQADDPGVCEAFELFWQHRRCPGGRIKHEPLWTYFELGQAHNYLFLGQVDRTWACLDHYLANHAAPGLYTYSEGQGDENSFGLWQKCRGWDRIPFVTPHGWTGAELILLMRDCLIRESEDHQGLVIGAGIPRSWLNTGQILGISHV